MIGANSAERTFAITICANEDHVSTDAKVFIKSAEGDVVGSAIELDGNGDGTGVLTLPANHTVCVQNTASIGTLLVKFDVSEP